MISSNLCFVTHRNSSFPNLNQIKFKFGWCKISRVIKRQVLTRNASYFCFWSSTVSIDGDHANKKRSILELLVMNDNLYDHPQSHKIGED